MRARRNPLTPLKTFMENLMRTLGAAILATSLLATNAFAATTLPAGKPAFAQKAQMEGNALLIVAGIGLAARGIGLAASSSGGASIVSTNMVRPPRSTLFHFPTLFR